jgi:hypothetical protein
MSCCDVSTVRLCGSRLPHLAEFDVPLQHACVGALLVCCGCAKVEGASNVRGAAVVLTARVNQQQCVAVNGPGNSTAVGLVRARVGAREARLCRLCSGDDATLLCARLS